jgi:hypothetical protein
MGLITNNITIATVKFFISDPPTSLSLCNWGLYRGTIFGTGSVLVGQASFNVPSTFNGLLSISFTAVSLQHLNFTAGEIFFVGYCGSLTVSSFSSTGNGDLDTTFFIVANYTGGFPATLTTGLTRSTTNIRVCASFFA